MAKMKKETLDRMNSKLVKAEEEMSELEEDMTIATILNETEIKVPKKKKYGLLVNYEKISSSLIYM